MLGPNAAAYASLHLLLICFIMKLQLAAVNLSYPVVSEVIFRSPDESLGLTIIVCSMFMNMQHTALYQ